MSIPDTPAHPGEAGLDRRRLIQVASMAAAASGIASEAARAQQPEGVVAIAAAADYVRDPTRWGSPEVAALFPGFQHLDMRTNGAVIRLRHGGSGAPLLLLHGNPQNHVCWHKVAARLAQRYHVVIPDLPSGGRLRGGGHWTRDIAFSLDGKKMYVSVGSHSNVDDTDNNPVEFHRADILEANPDGTNLRVYAWGIRNAVGIAVHPQTGALWASVNERDGLGDDVPPDYITHVQENGFYGWPWYYIGGNQDPRHKGKHPELKDKVLVPDVLIQPHNASLEMLFYEADQFPPEYRGSIFAAEHGSWNRNSRTGYEVIRVAMKDGRVTGEYEDFLSGFVTSKGDVWGRPVGVAVAKDGSLLVSDDGSNCIWRVSYQGK